MQCVCGSFLPSEMCCQQYIDGAADPPTAEALMRSRYTAFVQKNAQYIYQTYASEWRRQHQLGNVERGMGDVSWVGLEIVAIYEGGRQNQTGEVEFLAHYEVNGQPMTLHERSLFVREGGRWRYLREKG